MAGDRAYGSRANRAYLRKHGIKAVIPEKADQKAARAKKGTKGGRPPAFDAELYKRRNLIETGWPDCCHSCAGVSSSGSPSSMSLMLVA